MESEIGAVWNGGLEDGTVRSLLLLAAMVCAWGAETVTYKAVAGGVPRVTVVAGPSEGGLTWSMVEVEKSGGGGLRAWVLRDATRVARYVLEEKGKKAREYRDGATGGAVMPSMGSAPYLWPKATGAGRATYLGHEYVEEGRKTGAWVGPPADAVVVELRPDLWIGPATNRRQKDERRRYDGSDYEMIPLTRADYFEMAAAGVTCVSAAGEQMEWAEEAGLFFWGGHEGLPYPELLYRSQYLGPRLYLDEPAVSTRDYDIRPRLVKEPEYRKSITPQEALRAYEAHYAKSIGAGPPQVLMETLKKRADVDVGTMKFDQENLYNWETMPETAAWALGQNGHVPSAMVFEPPGRIGTRRTLPEWNMSYGTRFRTDDRSVLPAVIYGFLRGAARQFGKQWGVSIYGAVERADTFLWLTDAYDKGATRFHFWDNYQLACVPYGEVLAMARHLRAHARQNPRADLNRLRNVAERAILLPPGYGLGHTQTGRGNLWGLPELNLERVNGRGVKYRAVMSRFFAEIEKSLKEGVAFDLLWDLPGLKLDGYREVVRVTEDAAAPAAKPDPEAPGLTVKVEGGKAVARVKERRAPVYFTLGADPQGVLRNAVVRWELFGPNEEDYLYPLAAEQPAVVRQVGPGEYEAELTLPSLKPGVYRLRAAVCDTGGRTAVVWSEIRGAGR